MRLRAKPIRTSKRSTTDGSRPGTLPVYADGVVSRHFI